MEKQRDDQNEESYGRDDSNASQHSKNGDKGPPRYNDPDKDAERVGEVEEDENNERRGWGEEELTVESFDDEKEYSRSLVSDGCKRSIVMVLIFFREILWKATEICTIRDPDYSSTNINCSGVCITTS
ncbi:hypothetical protein QAD02_013091 [Eretmocerus hayati]|uniref:Uncharacterized protein n=1 Tax=Eretmocerus hayati TaxID=131215 RepID=A0ACC2P176_9HYME|nr:hypothetical protein QAD02_013091 [Eretmocerus hayati]